MDIHSEWHCSNAVDAEVNSWLALLETVINMSVISPSLQWTVTVNKMSVRLKCMLTDQVTWVESEDGRYHIAELMPPSAKPSSRPASHKLMSRIIALFNNGGPRGSPNKKFSVVSVRMLRNEHLASAFASTVQTMEQRMVRVGVIRSV